MWRQKYGYSVASTMLKVNLAGRNEELSRNYLYILSHGLLPSLFTERSEGNKNSVKPSLKHPNHLTKSLIEP
jgi:hypothetical protein